MLNQMVRAIFGFVFRVLLLLAGLVFLASMLTAALLVLAVWLVRAMWARLTGQPVSPWTFRVDRQAMWNRFYRAPGQGGARQRDDSDVIDAEVKEIKDVREIRDVKPPSED
jgi:membrane protein implicated in regulation of membrane protease activity